MMTFARGRLLQLQHILFPARNLWLARCISVQATQMKASMRSGTGPNESLHLEKTDKLRLRESQAESTEDAKKATATMKRFTTAGSYQEALDLFDKLLDKNHVHYDAALNVCKQALWYDKAIQIWSSMPSEGRSVVSYSTLIALCAKLKKASEAEALLGEMRSKGLVPNSITYIAMLQAYGMTGQVTKALDLFNSDVVASVLEDASIDTKQVVYLRVMIACAWAGDYRSTYDLFAKMVGGNIPPNENHFNALLTACAKAADFSTAEGVLDTMPRWNLTPRVEDYTAVVICCRNDITAAVRVFERMKAASVQPHGLFYQEMLQAYINAGDKAGGQALLDEASGWHKESPKMKRLLEKLESLP